MRLSARRKRFEQGQSLAEYALAITLVAVVVIAIAFAVGLGAERIFGIVGGAFGLHHDDNRQNFIDITEADCDASLSQGLTGLYVIGTTSEQGSDLTGSTNLAVGTGIDGAPFYISGGPGAFSFNPLLAYKSTLDVCPQLVVIQAKDGTEAFAPVKAQVIP